MPIDDRGFNRRQIPQDRGPIFQAAFQLWHGQFGYNVRRYSPSLEFCAFIAGFYCYYGYILHPSLSVTFGLLLPLYQQVMYEDEVGSSNPIQSILRGTRFFRPSFVFVVTYNGPDCIFWLCRVLGTHFGNILAACIFFILAATGFSNWRRGMKADTYFKYPKDRQLESNRFKREIRLLELHRWIPFRSVRVTLHTVSLENAPPYEAISYTWGSETTTKILQINGLPFKSTTATYNALFNCSTWWSTSFVWIDYICIDQSNSNEKSSQVPLMKDIYFQASQVIIWLSEPPNLLIIDWMIDAVSRLQDTRVAIDMMKEVGQLTTETRMPAQQIAQLIHRERSSHRIFRWHAFEDLLCNRWFSRVWIIQEVAVASRIKLLYGDRELDWRTLTEVMDVLQDPELAAILSSKARANVHLFHVMARLRIDVYTLTSTDEAALRNRRAHDYAVQLPLSFLLSKCDSFEATDARDKVYALLGLATDGAARVLTPSYESQTTHDVFISAARFILQSPNPYRILPYAGLSRHNPHNLPSWVPDWTRRRRYLPLDSPLHTHYSALQYIASGTSSPSFSLLTPPPFSSSPSLKLTGATIDTITALSPICDFDRTEHEPNSTSQAPEETNDTQSHPSQIQKMLNWHDTALSIAHTHCAARANPRSSIEDLFWRTLIGDQSPTFRPAAARLGDDYRVWISYFRRYALYLRQKSEQLENPSPVPLLSAESEESLAVWGTAMGCCVAGRRVAGTLRGYLGCVPPEARVGDVLGIVAGLGTVVVLRGVEGGGRYELVGDGYVHGWMDGEMVRGAEMGDLVIV